MSGTGCRFPGRLLTASLLALKPKGAEELGSALHPTGAHRAPGAFRAAPWGERCPRPRHSWPSASHSFRTHPLDVLESSTASPAWRPLCPAHTVPGLPWLCSLASRPPLTGVIPPEAGPATLRHPGERRATLSSRARPRESLWHAGPFPGGGKASGKPNLGKIPQSLFERLETTRRVIYRL